MKSYCSFCFSPIPKDRVVESENPVTGYVTVYCSEYCKLERDREYDEWEKKHER